MNDTLPGEPEPSQRAAGHDSEETSSVDFLVSYAAADRSWAEWIAWQLEDAGYGVVIQAWDFRPGSDFVTNMRSATVRAERTLALLSPAYVSSAFALAEWGAAFASDPAGLLQALIPIRVVDFAPVGLDRTRIYIDLVGLSEAEARKALLGGLSRSRQKPASRPTFPQVVNSVNAPPVPIPPRRVERAAAP